MTQRIAALCWIFALACTQPQLGVAESEVMGGSDAPADKWPDVAAVFIGGGQACTGTLIAPTVAITAGHCNSSQLTKILVGTSSLARPNEGEMINVSQRIEYPQSQSTYDVTILKLASASTRAPRPIATGWARFDIKNGARVALVGYGAIDRNASQFVDDLQEAETAITDFDCTGHVGCLASVQPAGELGAGGMGIDTCPGDSGGPLYLVTDYGAFLAGVTSRSYDDATYPCTDGGIYVRPDKIIDWIEQKVGGPVAKGPVPTADPIMVVKGNAATTQIVHNDPKTDAHSFAIKTPPQHGTATVRDDGHVKLCAAADAIGNDSLVVTVTDAADPTRALDVTIPIAIADGAPAASCDPEDPPPPGEEDPPNDQPEDSGGCCDSGRDPSGSLALACGALVLLRRRRRR
jgi:secreted trypsin-like serine protease